MACCEKCGTRLPEGAAFCPGCGRPAPVSASQNSENEVNPREGGVPLRDYQQVDQPGAYAVPPSYDPPAPRGADNGGFLWGGLGFFVPLVGLILFLVWRREKPRTAKAVGIGALVSVCIVVGLYALFFFFLFGISLL